MTAENDQQHDDHHVEPVRRLGSRTREHRCDAETAVEPAATDPRGQPTGFDSLGLRDELDRRARPAGLRGADPDPAGGHPRDDRAATTCSARPPPAPARPPRSRCPILQRLLARRATAPGRRRWCSSRPASWRCRSPRRCTATDVSWAPGCCRSTAASRSGRQLQVLAARRRRRRRDTRPGDRPPQAWHRCRWARCGSSCSTRPTRCSTWASPRTSRRSSRPRPTTVRRCCSRRRCRRASPSSPSAT